MKNQPEDERAKHEYKTMMKEIVLMENQPPLDPDADYLEPPYGLEIERIESGLPLEDDEDDVPDQPDEK